MSAVVRLMDATESLHNVSVAILDDLSGILYAIFPVDALTACMAFVEFAALAADRQMRVRKSFLLIFFLLVGYFLSACGSMLTTVVIFAMRFVQGDCIMGLKNCLCLQLVYSVGYLLVTDVSFLLAVDRTLAIVKPIWYSKDYKNSMLYGQLALVLFYVLLINVGMYVSSGDEQIPFCTLISASENQFLLFENLTNNVLLALTIIIYIVLIVWVKWKLYKDGSNAILRVTHQRQMKSKLLLTLAVCMFIHAATFYAGTLVGSFAMRIDNVVEAMSLAKYGVLVIISGPLNAIFLYCRTREIRIAVRRLIRKCGVPRFFIGSSRVFPPFNQSPTPALCTSTVEHLKTSECG